MQGFRAFVRDMHAWMSAYYFMHGICMTLFNTWHMHVPCMIQVHVSGIFYVWYRRVPCVVQASSLHACTMHSIGMFPAYCYLVEHLYTLHAVSIKYVLLHGQVCS